LSRVVVRIDSDKSGFDAGMKGVSKSLEGIKELVAGAFTVEAISSMVEKTIDFADSMDKASLRMKMTTGEVQTLSIIASEAGTNLETVENAFRKIELARAKALGGDKQTLAAFGALGVNMADLKKGGNIADLGSKVAKAASEGSNDKEGVALQNLGLRETAGDLTALGDSLGHLHEKEQELKAIGAIISDQDIANIVEMKDQWEELKQRGIASFAPILSGLFTGFQEFYVLFKSFFATVFASIMVLGDNAVTYIENLAKHFLSFGRDGKSVAGISIDAGKQSFDNLSSLGKDFFSDVKDGFADLKTEKAARDAKRASLRTDKGGATAIETVKGPTDKKIYSDSLTNVGNFLGASFKGVGHVTSALDLQKQANKDLANLCLSSTKLNAQMDALIRKNGGDTWMNTF
jgi:hypothetical protein